MMGLKRSPSQILWRINMSFGDVLYVIAIVLFAYLTFGIVRGYFKSKFDDEGRRIDMIEDEEEKEDKEEKKD